MRPLAEPLPLASLPVMDVHLSPSPVTPAELFMHLMVHDGPVSASYPFNDFDVGADATALPSYWTPTWVLVPLVVYIVWLLAPGCLGFREMVDLTLALTCPRQQHWHLRAASSKVGLTYTLQVTLIACLMWWRSLLCQFLLLWKVTYQMTTAVLHAVGLRFNWRTAQFTGRIACH
jgi:hypothetical protein